MAKKQETKAKVLARTEKISVMAYKRLGLYRNMIVLLAILGLVLSYYSIIVHINKLSDPAYEALCDLTATIRCSDVLTSAYSRGFGFFEAFLDYDSPLLQSNGVYGLFMYCAIMLTCIYPSKILGKLQLFFTGVSVIFTVYLSYILFVVLEEYCIVCISTYMINALLLVASVQYWFNVCAYLNNKTSPSSNVRASRATKKKV